MPINWDQFSQQNQGTENRIVGNIPVQQGNDIGSALQGLASLGNAIHAHNTTQLTPSTITPDGSELMPNTDSTIPYAQPSLGLTGTPETSRSGDYLNQAITGANSVYGKDTPMADIAAAQAILESRLSGKPSKLASDYNNYFGIKGKGTAGSASMGTQEYIAGKMRGTKAAFAANKTAQDSFLQHKNLMNNPRYANVLASKTPEEAAVALQRAGYATDPNYAKSLIHVLNTYVRPAKTNANIGQVKSAENNQSKYVDPNAIAKPLIPHDQYEDVSRQLDRGQDLALNSRQVLPYAPIPPAYNRNIPISQLLSEDIDSIMRNLGPSNNG